MCVFVKSNIYRMATLFLINQSNIQPFHATFLLGYNLEQRSVLELNSCHFSLESSRERQHSLTKELYPIQVLRCIHRIKSCPTRRCSGETSLPKQPSPSIPSPEHSFFMNMHHFMSFVNPPQKQHTPRRKKAIIIINLIQNRQFQNYHHPN